jgi:hypothetical protein
MSGSRQTGRELRNPKSGRCRPFGVGMDRRVRGLAVLRATPGYYLRPQKGSVLTELLPLRQKLQDLVHHSVALIALEEELSMCGALQDEEPFWLRYLFIVLLN